MLNRIMIAGFLSAALVTTANASFLVDFDDPGAVAGDTPSYVSGSVSNNFTTLWDGYSNNDSTSGSWSLDVGGSGGTGFGQSFVFVDLGGFYTFDGVAPASRTASVDVRRFTGTDGDDSLFIQLWNTVTGGPAIASTLDIAQEASYDGSFTNYDFTNLDTIAAGAQFDAVRIWTRRFGGSDTDANRSLVDTIQGNAVLVPEPASAAMLALAGGLLGLRRRR